MAYQTLLREICPTTAMGWVRNGALMVDVREQEEVDSVAYDVPCLLHIPLTDFENRYKEIPMDVPVVMLCRSGVRSLRAAGFLVHHGYRQVVKMQHGLLRWVQKGNPTKGDTGLVMGSDDCCSNPGCC
jgi:rhodanese-related sulfurtransferase